MTSIRRWWARDHDLTLRGLPNVRILLRNVLTTSLDAEKKAELQLPDEGYQVVLANPPFAARLIRIVLSMT